MARFFIIVVICTVLLLLPPACLSLTYMLDTLTPSEDPTSYNLTTYIFTSANHSQTGNISEVKIPYSNTAVTLSFYNRIVRMRGIYDNASTLVDQYILQTYDTLWLLSRKTRRTELIYTGTFEIATVNVYNGRDDVYIEWITRSMRPWCVLEYHSAPLGSHSSTRMHVSFCLLDHKNKKHPTYEESEVVSIKNDTIFAIGQEGATSTMIVHRWPIKNRSVHWRSTHQTVTSFCDVDHTHLIEVSNFWQMVVVLVCKQYGDTIPLAYLNVDDTGYISFYEYAETQYDIIYSFMENSEDVLSRVALDKVFARYASNRYVEYTLQDISNCTIFDDFYQTSLEE